MSILYYKDEKNCLWWWESDGKFKALPFGWVVVDNLNTWLSVREKELYRAETRRQIEHNGSPYAKIFNPCGIVSDEDIERFRRKCLPVYEKYEEDLRHLLGLLSTVIGIRNDQSNQEIGERFLIYKYYKNFLIKIGWDSIFDGASERELNAFQNENISFIGKELITIDGKFYPVDAYESKALAFLFPMDLWEILFNDSIQRIRICKTCKHLYFNNMHKSMYCEDCSRQRRKINGINRKNNEERYLHKRINDKLLYYNLDNSDFLNESNYYWDIVRGKSVEFNPTYRNDIKTKSDYMTWLNKTMDNLKATKKYP